MRLPSCIRIASVAASAAVVFAQGAATYIQHNLVSDVAGAADRQDTNLVNAWGLVHGPTSPWWVNANGTGVSILYDGAGKPFPANSPLVVTIPAPGGGTSKPTGIVFNSSGDFQLALNKPSIFLFASEDGTISGWNPTVSAQAVIKVNLAGSAIYKGLALAQRNGSNTLYAANFHAGTVDAFDATFMPVNLGATAFHDANLPAGYAPFNVQNINGNLAVTFAKQDSEREDDVRGAGNGYVDLFSPSGTLMMRLEHGKWLNSPWAVVWAPSDFGKASGQLLVGNFGSGQIAIYDPSSGEFEGLMRGFHGQPITIDGLWGLSFGNNANAGPANVLYFAAGPDGEDHGLFGTLTPNAKGKGDDDNGEDSASRGQGNGGDH